MRYRCMEEADLRVSANPIDEDDDKYHVHQVDDGARLAHPRVRCVADSPDTKRK